MHEKNIKFMNSKYKWLLFDADGTLLNYDKSEKHALSEALKRFINQ